MMQESLGTLLKPQIIPVSFHSLHRGMAPPSTPLSPPATIVFTTVLGAGEALKPLCKAELSWDRDNSSSDGHEVDAPTLPGPFRSKCKEEELPAHHCCCCYCPSWAQSLHSPAEVDTSIFESSPRTSGSRNNGGKMKEEFSPALGTSRSPWSPIQHGLPTTVSGRGWGMTGSRGIERLLNRLQLRPPLLPNPHLPLFLSSPLWASSEVATE